MPIVAGDAKDGEGRSVTGPKARRPAVAVALQRQFLAAMHLNSCRARMRRPHSEGRAAAVSMERDAHRCCARVWLRRAVYGLHARLAPGAVSVGSGEACSKFVEARKQESYLRRRLELRLTTAAPLAASAWQAACLSGTSGAVLSVLLAHLRAVQCRAAKLSGMPAGGQAAYREVRESAGHCKAIGAAIP